jgi:hypothetical protein
MYFRIVFILLSISIFAPAFGQQELLLSTQPDNIHATLVNPAYWPSDKKVLIGLPGLAIDGWHSGNIAYSDIFQTVGNKRTINISDFLNKLDDQNQIQLDQRTETISVGVKAGKHLRIMGHHAIRVLGSVKYPKEMAQLLWEGNGQFVGKTVQIDPAIGISGFNELALGAAYQIGPVNIGLRGKYLTGLGSVRTERFNANIYTNPDIYQLELETDISLISSGLIAGIDTTANGFDVQLVEFDRNQLFTQNTGIGFDAGVQFKVLDKLSVAVSALDIGASINWKNDVKRFTSKGEFTYEGVYFNGNSFLDQNGAINVENQLDTLKSIFQFKSANATYTQKLPARLYGNVVYQLSKKTDIGLAATFSQNSTTDTQLWGAGLSLGWKPIKQIKLGTMVSTNDHANVQIGSLIDVRLGPVRMYLAADNLVSAFSPLGQPNVQARYGFGLMF